MTSVPSSTLGLLLLTFVLVSCGSTSTLKNNTSSDSMMTLTDQNIADADTLTSPGTEEYKETNVYIKEVSKAKLNGELVIWIKGAYPDGCTQLLSADHSIRDGNTLILDIKGWRPTDRMCTQALVPFTFIYKNISMDSIKGLDHYLIDGRRYDFNNDLD